MPKKIPRFILSYVRSERDSFLDRFFRDLRKELSLREGLDNDEQNPEPGFRDTDSISGGSNWRMELAEALAASWACVSVYTPSYFQREACGKEFQVFLDRAGVQYAADGAVSGSKGILPVLWVSMEDLKRAGLPPRIAAGINFRATKHHARYESEGLRRILMRSPKTVYLDILNDIVQDLIAQFANRPAPLSPAPDYSTIKNAFLTVAAKTAAAPASPPAGPRCLHAFVIGEPTAASPVNASGEEGWLSLLGTSDPNLRVDIETIDPVMQVPPDVSKRLVESSARNALVFVIVESGAAIAHPAKVRVLLEAIVASEQWTGAILYPAGSGATTVPIVVPPAYLDRIVVKETASDAKAVADGIRELIVNVTSRIVTDSTVHQHAPGGANPSEKPKIRGPVEGIIP